MVIDKNNYPDHADSYLLFWMWITAAVPTSIKGQFKNISLESWEWDGL